MSEETYGTPAGGGEGSGNPPASAEPVSPQPGSQPAGGEPQGNEPVTRKDLEEWGERVLRSAQSMTDKMGSRLDTKIEAAIDEANSTIKLNEESGIQMTEQQKQDIRNRKISEAYAAQPSPQPSGQPAQPAPAAGEQGNQRQPTPFQQDILNIMRETGVYIDPKEANELVGITVKDGTTQRQWLNAFENICRTRQSNNQPSGPNAGIPSLAMGSRSGGAQTALMQQYQNEIAQIVAGTHPTIKRGDTLAVTQLEARYKQKGLDI